MHARDNGRREKTRFDHPGTRAPGPCGTAPWRLYRSCIAVRLRPARRERAGLENAGSDIANGVRRVCWPWHGRLATMPNVRDFPHHRAQAPRPPVPTSTPTRTGKAGAGRDPGQK